MSELTSSNNGNGAQNAAKAADQKFCFSCGTVLHFSASNCPQCGAVQPSGGSIIPAPLAAPGALGTALPPNHVYCRGCGLAVHETASACQKCGATQRAQPPASTYSGGRDRMTAALLAIFLGTFGVHKFYLGRGGQGVIYLLFFWTFIPGLIGFIEGIIYLTMSDVDFNRKYQ